MLSGLCNAYPTFRRKVWLGQCSCIQYIQFFWFKKNDTPRPAPQRFRLSSLPDCDPKQTPAVFPALPHDSVSDRQAHREEGRSLARSEPRASVNRAKPVTMVYYYNYTLSIQATGHEGLYGCEMLSIPHCLGSRLTDGGKVVSPTHRPRFTP
jgi:hypothetical protein